MATSLMTVLAQSSTFEEEPSALEVWVEDNSMLAGVIVFLVLFVFGLAWTLAAAHRNARQKAMAPTAAKHGLQFSMTDPFGSTKIAFPIFREGDGRQVENVMWRDDRNGRPIRVFDYSYYNEYRDKEGKIHKSWQHLSCAMGRHNGLWPTIRIARERTIDKVVQRIGLPDIELESEEFNRAFVIQCEDAKFATDLLAPEMMEFLLTSKALIEFETKGRWILLTTKRVGAQDMPGLVAMTETFLGRIPPLIWDIYPKAPDDTDFIPEEGLGFADLGASGSPGGSGIFIPGQDLVSLFRDEDETDGPRVEYDLDGNPIEKPPTEQPWT